MIRQWILLEIRGDVKLAGNAKALDALAEVCYDVLDANLQEVGLLNVEASEHCELCGRKVSALQLAWYPQTEGGLIFNCVDEATCLAARKIDERC